MLSIELDGAHRSSCDCCSGTTTTLTRFVWDDEEPIAMYCARFSDNHPDRVVALVVSLGDWSKEGTPDHRRAFSLKMWRGEDGKNAVMATDAQECPWNGVNSLGPILDRAEALADPAIKEIFHIADHLWIEDKALISYLNGTELSAGDLR